MTVRLGCKCSIFKIEGKIEYERKKALLKIVADGFSGHVEISKTSFPDRKKSTTQFRTSQYKWIIRNC